MGSSADVDQWVYCGRFGRPHGVRGAVRLWPHNPQTELLEAGGHVYLTRQLTDEQRQDLLTLPERAVERLTIRAARRDAKGWVVSFEELTSREEAQRVNLCDWVTRRSDFPEPSDDEFYFSDLIGAEGTLDDGRSIGSLLEVIEAGAGEILVFEGVGAGEVMVPFVWETFILTLDVEAKRIEIRAVKGLLEGGV